ncbi:MAG: thiol-disulfide oxidoreductase DCC family protein [Salinirussus sp.]
MASDAAGTPSATDDRTPEEIVADLEHPILLFDGVCNLCNGLVRFVIRFDDSGRYRFAPLQSDVGQLLQNRFDLNPDDVDTIVLVDDEKYYLKSDAIFRVLRHLDGPWPLLAPLRYLPRRLRDFGYDVVAKYRYRVFGRKDACPVPDPEIRDRFENRTFD